MSYHREYYGPVNESVDRGISDLVTKSKARAYSNEDLLEHLRQAAKSLRRVPTSRDIKMLSKRDPTSPSCYVYISRFGDFRQANILAGLIKVSEELKIWDKGSVRMALLKFIESCKERGVKPTVTRLRADIKAGERLPSSGLVSRHYRSFSNAMVVLGGRVPGL